MRLRLFIVFLVGVVSAEVIEPCLNYKDTSCFRRYLSLVSNCYMVHPDNFTSYTWKDLEIVLPTFNVTLKRANTNSTGYNTASVTKLLMHLDKFQTLFRVKFGKLVLEGNQVIQFHKSSGENVEVNTQFRTTFYDVSLTSTYDGIATVDFGNKTVFSHIPKLPEDDKSFYSPVEKAAQKDSFVKSVWSAMLRNAETLFKEEMDVLGNYVATAFKENLLCTTYPQQL